MAEPILPQKLSDRNDAGASSLWILWWNAMLLLRSAFVYARGFFWFTAVVAGIT